MRFFTLIFLFLSISYTGEVFSEEFFKIIPFYRNGDSWEMKVPKDESLTGDQEDWFGFDSSNLSSYYNCWNCSSPANSSISGGRVPYVNLSKAEEQSPTVWYFIPWNGSPDELRYGDQNKSPILNGAKALNLDQMRQVIKRSLDKTLSFQETREKEGRIDEILNPEFLSTYMKKVYPSDAGDAERDEGGGVRNNGDQKGERRGNGEANKPKGSLFSSTLGKVAIGGAVVGGIIVLGIIGRYIIYPLWTKQKPLEVFKKDFRLSKKQSEKVHSAKRTLRKSA